MYKIDLNEFGTIHCIANLKYHDDPSKGCDVRNDPRWCYVMDQAICFNRISMKDKYEYVNTALLVQSTGQQQQQ